MKRLFQVGPEWAGVIDPERKGTGEVVAKANNLWLSLSYCEFELSMFVLRATSIKYFVHV
jgi:hypothetical protein